MVDGDVRKKKANVIWKRETELMIVAPEIMPMIAVEELLIIKKRECVLGFVLLWILVWLHDMSYGSCFASAHSLNPRIKYLGVTVIPDAEAVRGVPVH